MTMGSREVLAGRLDIDAYRIGYGFFWRIGARRRLRIAGHAPARAYGTSYRPSTDRWRRNWQAEWEGCRWAPRAWTKTGVIRKAKRWRARYAIWEVPAHGDE